MAANGAPPPRVLVSNDDGVAAPGLRALAAELRRGAFCRFAVCGPSSERSAQSHAITIDRHLHAFDIPVEGAEEAFAVDGTPADSVLLALHAPLLADRAFDLVVSGINRGDNGGLHVIYSGTVGAAREAACKGLPAVAFSLAGYNARSEEAFADAARAAAAVVRATLSLAHLAPLRGRVLNVNFPQGGPALGIGMAFQSQHCTRPAWRQVAPDPHGGGCELRAGAVRVTAWRNGAGLLSEDVREGGDAAALERGWISVSLLGLESDLPLCAAAAAARFDGAAVAAAAAIVRAAAAELGVPSTVEVPVRAAKAV
jgi:5'-nucleotidase